MEILDLFALNTLERSYRQCGRIRLKIHRQLIGRIGGVRSGRVGLVVIFLEHVRKHKI